MAANDIRVFKQGSEGTRAFPMGAAAGFLKGEPVTFSAGTLVECGDDPPAVTGIALMRATDVDGTALSTGSPVTVALLTDDQRFVSSKFATDGAGTTATPTQANAIGVEAGFTLASGTWSVDTGCANLPLLIEAVLNSEGVSVADPAAAHNTTGVAVVFRGAS